MAESMIAGLLKHGLIDPNRNRRQSSAHRPPGAIASPVRGRGCRGQPRAALGADLIFLTVKPQVLAAIMKQLHGRLEPRQVAVSVVAGASVATLSRGLGHDAIVRVMPNTPAQIGAGMMVWAATSDVDDSRRAQVRAVLGALGEELLVEEEKYVDMATALSGTGPTYVFLMMEALIDAGVHMGFPRRIAEQIVLRRSPARSPSPATRANTWRLRNMVTSPGGTSAEAIYQMEKGGLRTVFSRAVYAAYQRTQTLARTSIDNEP
jgi:pyrroline-5-carboxylate reductase